MRTITQTQISAYERCRRSYYLKYIRELAWPVEKSSGQEMRRGADFHLLIRQLIMGLPEDSLILPSSIARKSSTIPLSPPLCPLVLSSG